MSLTFIACYWYLRASYLCSVLSDKELCGLCRKTYVYKKKAYRKIKVKKDWPVYSLHARLGCLRVKENWKSREASNTYRVVLEDIAHVHVSKSSTNIFKYSWSHTQFYPMKTESDKTIFIFLWTLSLWKK